MRPFSMCRTALQAAGLLVLGYPPRVALAHAILLESTPAVRSAVAAGPVTFVLRFNSRIDQHRSRLTLTGPDHTPHVLTLEAAPAEDTLTATVTLSPGAQTLRWQVLAIDGHITRGDVPFTVKAP